MRRWSGLLATVLCGAIVAACSATHDETGLEPPNLLEGLSNADLSARHPVRNGSPVEVATVSEPYAGAELYHGDDTTIKPRAGAPRGSGVARGPNGYELNFADAELSELTKVILRDTLGVPYVYDPRVQGRVTVSTGGPVSRNELLALLESVLAMNRGALLADGNSYRIVPEAEARNGAALAINYETERKEVGPGYGVSIIPLRYVSAETMTQMLASLGSKQDPARASVHNNLLILRGTAAQRQSQLDIVAMFDVDWMKGQSAGLYTLRNAAPDDVIKELQQVFQTEDQGKGLVRFQAINRLNAVLVLSPRSHLLEEVASWVSRLDRNGTEGENYYVYRVENGRAKDLTALLMAAFAGQDAGTRGAEEAEVSPGEATTRTETSSNGRQSSVTPVSATASRPEAEAEPAALTGAAFGATGDQQQSGSQVRIIPDERNNKLLIRASGRDLRKILSILRRIDQPPMQVLINATLAEVTLNDNLQYGVQFYLERNNGRAGLLGFSTGDALAIAPTVPGLNFMVGSTSSPRVVIDALAKQTAVRVVSSPSVVVLHNQPATLQVGDEVPITVRSATNVTTSDSALVNEIEYKNTGVILKVTPRINSSGLVTMEVEQEISAVTGTTSSDTLTPTISQRRITSTIAVESGQMVVLGGLISEQHNRDKSRIPVLGKIPYVGDVLGGSTDNSKARTELVVFLQPVVIRDPQDASRVAEEMRARLNSMAPRPTTWDASVSMQSETTAHVFK